MRCSNKKAEDRQQSMRYSSKRAEEMYGGRSIETIDSKDTKTSLQVAARAAAPAIQEMKRFKD